MRIRALILLATLLASASVAHAKSPVQLAPTSDGSALLMVNKTQGNEQWVLSLDADNLVLTGNVFNLTGKPPTFFFCDVTFDPDQWTDPAEIRSETLMLTCQVAGGCATLPCTADWASLGGDITLPGSFFLP